MAERDTEARHPAAAGLHVRPAPAVLATLLDAQLTSLQVVRKAVPALERVAQAGTQALARGGKMAYAGAGSSGLMALADCLELVGTFGLKPEQTPMLFAGGPDALLHMKGAVEDDAAAARADFDRAGLAAGDLVMVLSASGTTPYALAIAEFARAQGVIVAGFANMADSPLMKAADIPVLLETGPEVVAGSTRMAAATAQKVALNMVSVMVGIGLGHVYDGYMVNLIADNAKLVKRAARIVGDIANVPLPMAEAALAATHGAVKPAILVATGMDPEDAEDALRDAQGNLGDVLDD